MAVTRDYYEVLGIERGASGDDIKRAYRRMAMKYHPDRNPDSPDAEMRFKEAAEAYEILFDPGTRARYDKYGHDGLRGTPHHDFTSMHAEDIFSMFNDIFGGSGIGGGARSRSGRREARGYDLEYQIEITLEEVLTGCSRDIDFKRLDVCQSCSGSGGRPGSQPMTCPTCGGQGQVARAELGGMFRMVTTCPHCAGRGKVITDKCPDCRGQGRVSVRRELTVQVPAGIRDGQAVRVNGEGEPPNAQISPDGTGVRGDLHVVVRVRPHRTFERDGDNLILTAPIAFTQAALGADIEVPTLEGSAVFAVPAGTQHGRTFRLEGHGLPSVRSGARGDLIVLAQLLVPKKLDEKQRRLLEELAETEHLSVKPDEPSWWEKLKERITGG